MIRVNGFLDLDNYYNKLMSENNWEYWDLIYEGYIIDSLYCQGQFWLSVEGQEYYFKKTEDIYEELIASECAKFLGVDAVEYDLAIFQGKEGVLSKSYRKSNAEYISGSEILCDYLLDEDNYKVLEEMGCNLHKLELIHTEMELSDSINTLEIIWHAIEYRYGKKLSNFNMHTIMINLAKMFCFNILIGQNDAMPVNWEIEECKKGIVLNPFYDGSDTMLPINKYPKPSMSLSVNFNDKDNNNYIKLENFLKLSSEEFVSMFIELFDKLDVYNFMDIIVNVEKKIGKKIPAFSKRRIMQSFTANRTQIEEVVSKYRKGRI